MSTFTPSRIVNVRGNVSSTVLPREVALLIHEFPKSWVSAGIARKLLADAILSPYDDGSPSEFMAIRSSFICMETDKMVTACINLTFRDDLDDWTLQNHLNIYVSGWALPINIVHNSTTHRYFATIWEMHPSTQWTRNVLLERTEPPTNAKESNEANWRLEQKINENFVLQTEINKQNDIILCIRSRLKMAEDLLARQELENKEKDKEIATLRKNFFEWTRNVSKV